MTTGLLVDTGSADALATEAILSLKAKKTAASKAFDPSLGATKEEADAKLAHIRADLGAYAEYVHGHVPARHHRLWIDLIHGVVDGNLSDVAIDKGLLPEAKRGTFLNKLLLLAPPKSAKSTYCSIVLPTWYLGNHPDHRVLFFTSSDPNAVGFANTIKLNLEHNKEHKTVFPDREGRPNKSRGWSGDGLYLQATPMSHQSPAFRAVGWQASVMGARAELIVIDDPMDQDEAESENEQVKAKRYYDMTVSQRIGWGGGGVVAVMTRWHENDLASHFIQKAKEGGDWLIVALPMVAEPTPEQPDPLGREPGEILWPEVVSEKFVAAERRSMGTAQFACVFQCSAAQLSGGVFRDEKWFKPLPPNFLETASERLTFQAWDVGFSEKDTACPSVCLTFDLDRDMNMYLRNVFSDQMTTGQMEDAMVEQILLFRPNLVGIEDTAFKHSVTTNLVRRVMARAFANIQVVAPRGMTRGASDKVARARLPAARAEAGQVYADKDAPWWPSFISQVLGFPRGKGSDQVDAFSLGAYLPTLFEGTTKQKPRRVVMNPD